MQSVSLNSPFHPAVLDILSVPLPNLRQIIFYMNFDDPKDKLLSQLKSLDKLLSNSPFPRLMTVRIDYDGFLRGNDLTQCLQRAFPGCCKRGVLHIRDGKEVLDPSE